MTWAKNYGDRTSTGASPGDRRAKKTEKKCAKCGAGIDSRKTYCGPCYSERLEANIAAGRHRYRKKGTPDGSANPV